MQKEAEPRALAPPGLSHPVHPVVPIACAKEGEAVFTRRHAPVDRAEAMLEQGLVFRGNGRRAVCFVFLSGEERRLQERNTLIQDAGVAGCANVLRDRERQPEEIVGAMRADARAAGRVPPVLHVALDELPRRRQKDVRASQLRRRERQRHDVLQLIAEPVRAAGLIISAARPQPAADRLIQQPAVQQRIERIVGRPHPHGVQGGIPRRLNPCARCRCRVDAPVARDQHPGMIASGAFSQEKNHAPAFSGPQHASNVKAGAWIQRRADLTGERGLLQCGRL